MFFRTNKIFEISIMDFVWTSSKEEELIEFWKTVPALFDPGLRSYSKRTDRENALQEISERLGTTG